MPAVPVFMQVKFRPKKARKRAMPNASTQANAQHRILHPRPILTPPPSHVGSAPASPTTSFMSASTSSIDTFDTSPVRGSRRRRSTHRPTDTHVHITLGNITVTSPAVARPTTRSIGVQAGTSYVPQSNPDGLWARAERLFYRCKPYLSWLSVVPMFFADRMGFGINLTDVFLVRR